MGDTRSADPDHLEQLANRLCTIGYGGIYGQLATFFDRARAWDASSELTRLVPLLSWLTDTADHLRDSASLLRGETPSPPWGGGAPTPADIEAYQESLRADPHDPFEVLGQENIDGFLALAQQEHLTEEELEEMRSLLGAFSSDPAFAAELIDQRGVAEFLALTRRIEGTGDSEAARDLRGELGHILTAAFWVPGDMRPGTEEYENWISGTAQGQAYAERLRAFQYSGEENLADAAQLAATLVNADDLTATGLVALNEFLANNDHPESGDFNRALMSEISPEGLVHLAERLPELALGGDEELRDGYDQLQANIANSLANATNAGQPQPGDPWYQHWVNTPQAVWYEEFMAEFSEVGRSEHTISFSDETNPHGIDNVRGYQMLLNLMEEGHGYSTGFLTDVADDIRDAEGDGTHFWHLGPTDASEIQHGTGDQRFARDPMNSVLGIMGDYPDAATTYLSDEENLDYLIDRDWLPTFGSTHHDPSWDYGGFGNALEAATTGHPAGTDQPYARTPEGDQIMREVVERFSSDNGALIADDGPLVNLRPRLASMSAAYMGEIQHNLTGIDLMYDDNPPTLLDDVDVDHLLFQVGRDPDAYATIIGAQQAYTTIAVDVAMNLVEIEDPPTSTRIEHAVSPGAVIAGIMSSARADAVRDGIVASDEVYNSRLGLAEEIAGLVIEESTGRVPVLGGAVGWGANHLSESIFNQFERDSSQQAYEEGDNQWQSGRDAAMASAENAIEIAAGDRWSDQAVIGFQNCADSIISTKYNEGINLHWDGEE